MGLWYPNGKNCVIVGYVDSEFSRCKLDRKSTSGTCHLLGKSLVSWHLKKQTSVMLSKVEEEYVAAGSCCAQIIWMKHQLSDYGVNLGVILVKCDTTSVINLTKNLILHSRKKYIELRYHFIKDRIDKGTSTTTKSIYNDTHFTTVDETTMVTSIKSNAVIFIYF